MSVSAPAHARFTSRGGSTPDDAWLNTKRGSDDCGPENGSLLIESKPKAVSSSGAVSPVTRATASMTPVVMPADAVGSTTLRMVRHRGMPRA